MKLIVNVASATNLVQQELDIDTTEFPEDKVIVSEIRKSFGVQMLSIVPIQKDVRIKRVRRKESFTIDTNFYPADKTVIEVLVL